MEGNVPLPLGLATYFTLADSFHGLEEVEFDEICRREVSKWSVDRCG